MIVLLKYLMISLIATVFIELIISLLLGVKSKKDLFSILLINIITNLSLNLIINIFVLFINYNTVNNFILPALEVFVIIIEGFCFKRLLYDKLNSYVLSIILNLSSYLMGVIYLLLFK